MARKNYYRAVEDHEIISEHRNYDRAKTALRRHIKRKNKANEYTFDPHIQVFYEPTRRWLREERVPGRVRQFFDRVFRKAA